MKETKILKIEEPLPEFFKGYEAWVRSDKDPEFAEMIKKVNFNVLKSILRNVALKSGVKSPINFLDANSIYNFTGEAGGTYDTDKNIIGLNLLELENDSRSAHLDMELMFLKTLCHEEVHASAKIECKRIELAGLINEEVTAGYAKYVKLEVGNYGRPLSQKDFFRFFNEGVTEKLAREILSEYLKETNYNRSQDTKKKAQELLTAYKERPKEVFAYGLAIKIVELLSKKIAREVGVEEKNVWQAFVRGAFEGGVFEDEEIKKSFDEIINKEFLKALSDMQTEEDMRAIINYLE